MDTYTGVQCDLSGHSVPPLRGFPDGGRSGEGGGFLEACLLLSSYPRVRQEIRYTIIEDSCTRVGLSAYNAGYPGAYQARG